MGVDETPEYEAFCQGWNPAYTQVILPGAKQDSWKEQFPIEWFVDARSKGFPTWNFYVAAKLYGVADFETFKIFEKSGYCEGDHFKCIRRRQAAYNYMIYLESTTGDTAARGFKSPSDKVFERIISARATAKDLELQIEKAQAENQHVLVLHKSLTRIKLLLESIGLAREGDKWEGTPNPFESVTRHIRLPISDAGGTYHTYRMLCNEVANEGKEISPAKAREVVEFFSMVAQELKYHPV